MRHDQAAKGWNDIDLAKAAKVHQTTVSRWFAGSISNPKLAKKLARALGYSVRRYLIASSGDAVAS
jgi:ribosome-binding protein aMBF1 (putative translation factor)